MTLPWPDNNILKHIDNILDNLPKKRIGVLGLGVVGNAMAIHLIQKGAHVIGVDKTENMDKTLLNSHGIEVYLGYSNIHKAFSNIDALAISPGVDPRQEIVQTLIEKNIPIFGELELIKNFPAKIVAITGTNGKSSTTALTATLLRSIGKNVFVGGNFGQPIISWIDKNIKTDIAILELSSFQLESAYRFRADIGVLLNLSPDHRERYDDHKTYCYAKKKLFDNLKKNDIAILNADDLSVQSITKNTLASKQWFSTSSKVNFNDGISLSNHNLKGHGVFKYLDNFDLQHPHLLGTHNYSNTLAAITICSNIEKITSSNKKQILDAYQNFKGLPHRLEYIAQKNGVHWINDSKSTNDLSTSIALKAIKKPVLLLLGGIDKGAGYKKTYNESLKNTRFVFAYGQARNVIAKTFKNHPGFKKFKNFQQALNVAKQSAIKGDSVLLSPACSSFDEFKNYQERGNMFRAFVKQLNNRK